MSHINQNQFTTTPRFIKVARIQMNSSLEVLGHKRGDAVYIRAFIPKEDPRYDPNTVRKADNLNWKQIEGWQAQGYSICIVVNGGGGDKDEDVQTCRTVLIEHDDLEIELQAEGELASEIIAMLGNKVSSQNHFQVNEDQNLLLERQETLTQIATNVGGIT